MLSAALGSAIYNRRLGKRYPFNLKCEVLGSLLSSCEGYVCHFQNPLIDDVPTPERCANSSCVHRSIALADRQ